MALSQREAVGKTLEDLLEAGIIYRSNSPWNFPLVVVEKKAEKPGLAPKYRICVDFRRLNDCVKLRSHPLPLIDDILAELQGSTFFTTLDLRSGFHQIPLTKSASQKCAFSCFKGKFAYATMPFGIKNGPNVFQEMVTKLLLGCEHYAIAFYGEGKKRL